MQLSDFNYQLDKKQIAKLPAVPRDSSKLLILNKQTGQIKDDYFYNLDKYLQANDLLVRNNTKVIPARIYGTKETGGKIEVLLTKKVAQTGDSETWECLTKPGIKPNQRIIFSPKLKAKSVSKTKQTYTKLLKFNQMGPELVATLEKIGITPLPPYIADTTKDSQEIRKKYQTIYAKFDGSAAAPTAGLHFTKKLENKLKSKGVKIAELTLHVGLGTFLPVKTNNILEHKMHSEWFEINKDTADKIKQTINSGGRIISVGTTSTRVLESTAICKDNKYYVKEKTGETDIFIYPGYKFKIINSLITNFHLPESTLLMLVSALVSHPNTQHKFNNFLSSPIGKAYLHAIEHNYRFYSFGDAMLII